MVTVSITGSLVVAGSVCREQGGHCLFPESLILTPGPVSTSRSPAEVGRADPTWPTLAQKQAMLFLS